MTTLARGQHAHIRRDQLLACGFSSSGISRLVAEGTLVGAQPRLYRLAGAPSTWEGDLYAAVESSGGVASHRSAAYLWGLLPAGQPIEVTVPRGNRPRLRDVVVHRQSPVPRGLLRDGIRTTTPMRAMVDLGAVVQAQVLADAVEVGLISRLFTCAGLRVELEQVGTRGRLGAGVLRAVLDTREVGERPTESVLEARMAKLITRYRLPRPVFQHEVSIEGIFIARVDFAYPELRLAIEVDGWSSRATPADLQRSNQRQNELIASGWTVLRVTWLDVVTNPSKVAADIAREILRLRAAAAG